MRYWFVFVTLLNAAAFAEKPLAVIDGPSVGNVGDFVRLSATESVADHVAFSVVPETLPDGRASFMLFDDNRTILIASVPGRYLVILAAATDEGIDVRQHVVTIGNVTPRPEPQPPTPTPTPPEPEPMFPAGRYGLADKAYNWAKSLDAKTASTIANNLETVTSRSAAGGYADANQLVRDTVARNRASVPAGSLAKWSEWFSNLEAELDSLADAKKLKSQQDYVDAWTELAEGLKAVK